jgi:subtilisin family serine protease
MDQVSIKYGDRQLTLNKSEDLVAVKPSPGVDRQRLMELVPAMTAPLKPGAILGGFQLVSMKDVSTGMEQALDTMRADPAIQVASHVFHTSQDHVPFVPTGQLFIECAADATREECEKLLDQHQLQVVEARGDRELIVQVTPGSQNPVKVARALQDSPLIAVAEPDLATPGRLHQFVLPGDSRILDQWHLRNTGFHRGTSVGFQVGADARVMDGWEMAQSLGSPNVVVAVIDDGFDLSHPDLSGEWKIVAPRDFTRNSASPLPDLLAQDWHGTACAGVAVGNADGAGIVGAAPRCRLMPIRWGRGLSDREVEDWFGHAREQGAWVVSCSWSAAAEYFPLSTRASRAIERCAREGRGGLGTVICFAAGNESRDIDAPEQGSVNGFAIHPDVIAVAASNSRDRRSSYSNFGAAISVCAPSSGAGGWGITTTDVMGQYTRGSQTFEAGYSPGAYTDDFGGTSSACPLVAGVCAVLLSIRPELRAAEVKELIQRTARPMDGQVGHTPEFGHGCINAAAAIEELLDECEVEPAWGEKGHRSTNRIAVIAVPDPLRAFYQANLDSIEGHAMDADAAKRKDPAERPRHFIDIDLYGDAPFPELPEEYEAAVARFGEATVKERGILPWQIEQTFNDLVEAFRNGRVDAVLKQSAWLGHYVGDAHVPLHTTANHNGQLTGQKGLHSYFETRLLNEHVFPEDIHPSPGQLIEQPPHVAAFAWVRESHSYVQPLLDADAAHGGKTGRRSLKGFATTAKPIAIERLTLGCSRLASLWYTAWVEAGKPDLPAINAGWKGANGKARRAPVSAGAA